MKTKDAYAEDVLTHAHRVGWDHLTAQEKLRCEIQQLAIDLWLDALAPKGIGAKSGQWDERHQAQAEAEFRQKLEEYLEGEPTVLEAG
jgi:hypothetical protein